MKRYKVCSSLSMLIEPKIIIIVIILFMSFVFGIKYINKINNNISLIIEDINKVEENIIENTETAKHILIIDNKLLTESLNKSITVEEIDKKTDSILNNIISIKGDDSIVSDLSKILESKKVIYKKITEFDSRKMDFDKIKKSRKISVVSKNIKRGIFSKNIDYDTITKGYDELDISSLEKEYSDVVKYNNNQLITLIKINNQLTLSSKVLIDSYIKKRNSNLLREKEMALNNIITKFYNYIFMLAVFIIVILILIYFLISDIMKVLKTNKRNDNIVHILLNKLKKKEEQR